MQEDFGAVLSIIVRISAFISPIRVNSESMREEIVWRVLPSASRVALRSYSISWSSRSRSSDICEGRWEGIVLCGRIQRGREGYSTR